MLFAATAGAEILICIASGLFSLRFAYRTKKDVNKKNEGTFSVKVLEGLKDYKIINTSLSASTASCDRLSDVNTLSADSGDPKVTSRPLLSDNATGT